MDYRIARALDHFAVHHDGFEDVLRAYSVASQYLFVALVLVLVVAAIVRGEVLTRSAGVLAGASAVLALAVGKVISTVVDRPRPFVTHPSIHDFLAHAPDAGMPSDHATAAFAIGTAILLSRRRLGIVVLVGAAVIALGRVFLGVHYLSDVAVGALLGAGAAVLVWKIAQRLPAVTAPKVLRREPAMRH